MIYVRDAAIREHAPVHVVLNDREARLGTSALCGAFPVRYWHRRSSTVGAEPANRLCEDCRIAQLKTSQGPLDRVVPTPGLVRW